MAEVARGECPNCGMPIPFGQTISRRGQPFVCRGCGASLVLLKPNLVILMIVVAVALLFAKLGGFLAFLVAALVIAVGDWKLAPTRIERSSGS